MDLELTRRTRRTLAIAAACGAMLILGLTAIASADRDKPIAAHQWNVNEIHAASAGSGQ